MVALESAELFRNLKPEELMALRQVAAERQFAAGEEIFREGDRGDGLYVVKDGLVEISGLINHDTRRVFSRTTAGASERGMSRGAGRCFRSRCRWRNET